MSVYASTDWHGNLAVAEKVFNFLKPEDELYYLGDCADRGPDGIKIFDMLSTDSRVTFLKGNHEQFMKDGIVRWRRYGITALSSLWAENGGASTAEAIESSNDCENVRRLAYLHHIPITADYFNENGKHIILNHCGFTPLIIKNGPKEGEIYPNNHLWEPMWDREHFNDIWDNDPEYSNIYMVHGHTPVNYLIYHYHTRDIVGDYPKNPHDFDFTPVQYAGGHKIDLDVGTYVTNKTYLLDLNTFEMIKISAE